MTIRVAKAGTVLNYRVSAEKLLSIAAVAGATVDDELADTGSASLWPVAAAVVLAGAGLMILPAVRRRED